jgi:hypothetical protein
MACKVAPGSPLIVWLFIMSLARITPLAFSRPSCALRNVLYTT